MDKWPYPVSSLTQDEIHEYTNDPDWQKFRRNLKGKPTVYKLRTLKVLRDILTSEGRFDLDRAHEVRIDNYINALKRGGQLDEDGNIKS